MTLSRSIAIFHLHTTMPHSDTSWDEQQRLLADAKTLAEFANLEPSGVETFRKGHPDFFPASWWEYAPTPPEEDDVLAMQWPDTQWQITQRFIRGFWRKQFQMSTAGFVTLLGSVFDPEKMGWDRAKERLPVAMGLDLMYMKDFPYHTVVRWLVGQSWRVKQCEHCGKCFIAEASQRRYCSNDVDKSCFSTHRQTDRRNSADEVNKNRRNNYDPEERRLRYRRDKKRKA